MNLIQWMKLLMMLAAVFCITSIGIFFVQSSLDEGRIANQAVITLTQIQSSMKNADATVTDIRRTVEIAGGTLNIARDTLRNEQASIKEANQYTIQAMNDLDLLVKDADVSQKQVVVSTQDTLKAVQATTESVVPVMQQTQKDLETLQPVIIQTQTLLKQTTDTMEHVSGATQDIQAEIHHFVYPPPKPWYDKYIINPVKLGLKMLTIPITK